MRPGSGLVFCELTAECNGSAPSAPLLSAPLPYAPLLPLAVRWPAPKGMLSALYALRPLFSAFSALVCLALKMLSE